MIHFYRLSETPRGSPGASAPATGTGTGAEAGDGSEATPIRGPDLACWPIGSDDTPSPPTTPGPRGDRTPVVKTVSDPAVSAAAEPVSDSGRSPVRRHRPSTQRHRPPAYRPAPWRDDPYRVTGIPAPFPPAAPVRLPRPAAPVVVPIPAPAVPDRDPDPAPAPGGNPDAGRDYTSHAPDGWAAGTSRYSRHRYW
jgi:hypothetical protein